MEDLKEIRDRLESDEFNKELVIDYITKIHDLEIEDRLRREVECVSDRNYGQAGIHNMISGVMLSWKCQLLADLGVTKWTV